MHIFKSYLIFSLFLISHLCSAQNDNKNVFELGINFGLASTFGSLDVFQNASFSGIVEIDDKSAARVRGFNLSYTRFLNDFNGIKIIFGRAKYGFDFKIPTANPDNDLLQPYRATHSEFGFSYLRRIPINNETTFIIEPGLLLHTGVTPESNTIFILHTDSYSFSYFSGFEFPIAANNSFINTGVIVKIPLKRYDYDYNMLPGHYPYFIGIKVGISFQY